MTAKNDRIIYQIFTAQLRLKTLLRQRLRDEGVGITLTQAGVLFLLQEKDGQRMNELSAVLGIDNSTMTGYIDRLEKSGYVKRKPCPDDRRALLITITPTGRDQADKASPVINAVNDQILSGLSNQEIDGFKSVLNKLSSISRGSK